MHWSRFYTQEGLDPSETARFRTLSHDNWQEYLVPQHWNQVAQNVLLDKVFYPRPLPAITRRVAEEGVPEWLWKSEADDAALDGISAEWRYRVEKDFREVLKRVAGAATYRAWKNGFFASESDARIFYDELRYVLLHQIASPEAGVWSTLGLNWAYGVTDAPVFAPRHNIASFDASLPQALKRVKIMGETLALDETALPAGVTLPVENIDSPAFVAWKKDAEIRQVTEQLGGRILNTVAHQVMDACDRDSAAGFDPESNEELRQAVAVARVAGLPETAIRAAISYAEQGYEEISLPLQDEDVRRAEQCIRAALSVSDSFVEAALTGHSVLLYDGDAAKTHYPAEKLWNNLADAVWSAGEPAIAFRDSIDAANVTGAPLSSDASGAFIFRAGASAPSATINLLSCETDALEYVARLITVALDGLSDEKTGRPLLLGVTNLSAFLMSQGMAYDSEAGRVTAALLASLVSGAACRASAEMAAIKGAYDGYAPQAKVYLQQIKDRLSALAGAAFLRKGATRRPQQLRVMLCPDVQLAEAARRVWEEAYTVGKETGFRHAHLTGIGTDLTVQALLNAQTEGIMPESALVRFESYFADTPDSAPSYGKKLNPMVPKALAKLGYTTAEIGDIYFYAVGHGTLLDAPGISHKILRAKGFHQAALDAVESALATAQHIRYAFNKWTLGDDFCERALGFSWEQSEDVSFDMLTALGFTEDEIYAANLYCCGAMTLEGAPHLRPHHLAVFDCLAPASTAGVRRVAPEAQVKMQAAVETFLTGGVAHTLVLSHATTIAEVQKLIMTGWELGVKHLRLYREGCSMLSPLALPLPVRQTEEEEDTECHKQSMRA